MVLAQCQTGGQSPRHHGDECCVKVMSRKGSRRTLLRDSAECVLKLDKYNVEQSNCENEVSREVVLMGGR